MSSASMDAEHLGPETRSTQCGRPLPASPDSLQCGERPECVAAFSIAQAAIAEVLYARGVRDGLAQRRQDDALRAAAARAVRIADYPPVDPAMALQRAAARARVMSRSTNHKGAAQ